MSLTGRKILALPLALAALALMAGGCMKEDMASQPKQKTGSESTFFADGQADRPLINGTVPRGMPMVEDSDWPTQPSGAEATAFPADIKMDADALRRGQTEFDIYCALCHGRLGDGRGMIPMRGFVQPPSYYNARLRAVPVGHFYNVISHGYGAMYSYNDRILPDDRWKISGYIRVLQASDPTDNGTNVPDNNRRK
jgi:mono/diheme cytochrome c family protein